MVYFTESGSASIDVSESQLSDGFHGEGAACVPTEPPGRLYFRDQGARTGIEQADYDGDGFDDTLEDYVGTDPVRACGVHAWPADIFHDRISDIRDISRVTAYFGKRVPTRRLCGSTWRRLQPSIQGDLARITGHFGKTCETFGTDTDNGTYAIMAHRFRLLGIAARTETSQR